MYRGRGRGAAEIGDFQAFIPRGRGGFIGHGGFGGREARASQTEDANQFEYGSITRDTDKHATTIKWRIPNLERLHRALMPHFSQKFKLFDDCSTEATMFYDSSTTLTNDQHMGLLLKELCDDPLKMSARFWMETSSGRRFNEFWVSPRRVKASYEKFTFGFKTDQDTNILTDCINGDKILIFCCELERWDNLFSSPTPATHSELGNKLWQLYQEGIGNDATIQADGKEFKVLSAVLMSQSEVFKDLLTKSKTIEIDDLSADVMEALICWLYTGQLVDEKLVEEIFIAANKYKISGLKTACGNLIVRHLTEENAAKRLALASTYDYVEMKKRVMNYISMLDPAKINNIFESKAWYNYLTTLHHDDK